MGMFSWVDVDGSQNITDEDEKVILLIPHEHKEAVSKIFGTPIEGNGIEGKYDGYGSVADKSGTESDAYDVMTFINICLTSEEQFNNICFYTSKLHPDECSPMKEVADEARQAYQNGKIKSVDDLEAIADRFGTEFRVIGITIGSNDEQNARLPYPMKWTVDESRTYENSLFSMDDPNQGFSKTRIADKASYEFYERDWDYGDGSDPYWNWCDSGDKCKYDNIEELEELNEKRDAILVEVRAEQESKQAEQAGHSLDDDDEKSDDDLGLD